MKTKMLKIIDCSDPMMWYAKNIGKHAVYLGEDMDARGPIYWSRDNGGYKNIVFQKDATVEEIDVVIKGSD